MGQISKGAILSYVQIFLTFVIGLIYTPILIKFLGKTDYGLYSLVISLVSYLSLMDMGLGNAIVRYISKNRIDGNKSYEAKLLGFFLKFYLIIGIVTLILGINISFFSSEIFGGSLNSTEVQNIKWMIFILSINFSFAFILNVFTAAIHAYERFVFLKILNIIKLILAPILTVILLINGGGLIGITIITTSVNMIVLLIGYFYAKKYLKIKVKLESIDKKIYKEIYFYSFFIFISALADRLYWQTDQILLGILESPQIVAIYAIGIQLVMIFASLSTAISNLYLPKITQLVITNDSSKHINRLFNDVSRYQFIILSLFFSGFIIFGKRFIEIWVGNDFIEAYLIIVIIMIPFFVELIQNVAFSLMQAKGVYYFRAIALVISAILNLLISIPIIKNYGMIGTAIVTSVFIAIVNILVMNFFYHYKLGLNMVFYWKNTIFNIFKLSPLICSFYVFLNNYSYKNNFIYFIYIFIYTSLFFIIVYKFILNKSEKTLVTDKLKRLLKE